jgi:hypothetical protein
VYISAAFIADDELRAETTLERFPLRRYPPELSREERR